jgi:N2,N2-dimethylguanosine tRNA methyltransferase
MLWHLKKNKGKEDDLPTSLRVEGVLKSMSEELKDCPFYYVLPELFSCLHSEMPPMIEIISAIKNAGYESSRFHNESAAIKTNAPNYVIWDILRAYCRLNPPRGSSHKVPTPSAVAILSKVSRTIVSFKIDHNLLHTKGRFYQNPEPEWGPGKRGKRDLEPPLGMKQSDKPKIKIHPDNSGGGSDSGLHKSKVEGDSSRVEDSTEGPSKQSSDAVKRVRNSEKIVEGKHFIYGKPRAVPVDKQYWVL